MKIDMGHIVLGWVVVGLYLHQRKRAAQSDARVVGICRDYLYLSTLFSDLVEVVVEKNSDLLLSEKLQDSLAKFQFNEMMRTEGLDDEYY